jgi:hypothetical protein
MMEGCMGGAKGWVRWATTHPRFQKSCDLSIVVLVCGTVAAHLECFSILQPTRSCHCSSATGRLDHGNFNCNLSLDIPFLFSMLRGC